MVGTTERVLVGRLAERRSIADWLRAVRDHDGAVLVVRGESGVGKSSIVDHLTHRAGSLGFTVVLGVGESGSPLPYGAVADWLSALVADAPAGASEADVEVVREAMTSTLGDHTDISAADASQVRLHLAVTNLVRAQVQDDPLVVVVEDAQWLDDASVALVAHLTTALFRSRAQGLAFGIVLSVRSGGVPAALDRIVHGARTSVLDIDVLDATAVGQLVSQRWGLRVATPTAVQLRDASGGNPLTAIAVVEVGLQRGAVEVVDDELVVVHPSALAVADVDSQVVERVEAVSSDARKVVQWAAVLGHRPELADLEAVAASEGMQSAEVESAIDDLVDSGLLEDRGDAVRFSHAEIRAAILHHIGSRRRARLHLVMSALREPESDRDVLAAARHLELAGPIADQQRLAELADAAGDICLARFSWTDAVRFLCASAAAKQRLGLEPSPTSWHSMAVAERMADDPEACIVHARRAAAGYRQAGDVEGWGAAELLASREELACRPQADAGSPFPATELWEWLDASGTAAPGVRARALAFLAEAHMAAGEHHEATLRIADALEVAESIRDHSLLASIEISCGLQELGGLDVGAARLHLDRAVEHAEAGDDRPQAYHAISRLALTHLVAGDPRRALSQLRRLGAREESVNHRAERSLKSAVESAASAAAGLFDEAELRAAEAIEHVDASGYAYAPLIALPAQLASRALRGDRDGALEVVSRWEGERKRTLHRWRWLVDITAGSPEDAERVGHEMRGRTTLRGRTPVRTLFGMWVVACQAELAMSLARPDLAADVLADLRWLVDRGAVFVPTWPFFVPRLLAVAEAITGDVDAARSSFDEAERRARDLGQQREVLRSVVDRAHLGLLEDDDAATAAAAELDALGLGAVVPGSLRLPTNPVGVRYVAFADLVDSTPLNVAVGDQRFAQLIDEMTVLLRRDLRSRGGVEFKHTGDGLAAWFTSATGAIRWAEHATARLRRATAAHPDEVLQLRFGIAAGEPVDLSGDLFGTAVVMAARLCDGAAPGRILVDDEVRGAADHDVHFADPAWLSMKGFADDVLTHTVVTYDTE